MLLILQNFHCPGAARKDTEFPDFDNNFIIQDSLESPQKFAMVELEEVDGYQQFDIVIGHPQMGCRS